LKTVELVPGRASSVIGFGCASLMGAVDKQAATRAIAAALEADINHFDVAPSYGYGEAESLLGETLPKSRDHLVVVTKYGIETNPLAGRFRSLKSVVRPAFRLLKRTVLRGPAVTARLAARVRLTPEGMRISVERSLSRLRAECLDGLLLHDPADPSALTDDLRAAASDLIAAGKIQAFGVTCPPDAVPGFLPRLDASGILQIAAPASVEAVNFLAAQIAQRPISIYSPGSFCAKTGMGYEAGLRALHDLLPNAVLLCAASSAFHIRANVESLR